SSIVGANASLADVNAFRLLLFITQDLALVDPDLDTDLAERRIGFSGAVVDVGTQGLERNPPLAHPLRARHFGATQATGHHDPDTLCALAHRLRRRTLHGAAVGDAALKLARDVLRHQLGLEIGLLDFLNLDANVLAGEFFELLAQLLHGGALTPNHDAGARRVQGHLHLVRIPLDLDV